MTGIDVVFATAFNNPYCLPVSPVPLVGDTFTRADVGGGSLGVEEVNGIAWALTQQSGTAVGVIASGAAGVRETANLNTRTMAALNLASVPAVASGYASPTDMLQIKFKPNVLATGGNIVFLAIDQATHLAVTRAGTGWTLAKRVNATATNYGAGFGTATVGQQLEVRVVGTSASLWIAGTKVQTADISGYLNTDLPDLASPKARADCTKVGMLATSSAGSAARWDDLDVKWVDDLTI